MRMVNAPELATAAAAGEKEATSWQRGALPQNRHCSENVMLRACDFLAKSRIVSLGTALH